MPIGHEGLNKMKVIFTGASNEILGEIELLPNGSLVASERVEWVKDLPLAIGKRTIQPEEDDFLRFMPVAYSGSCFRATYLPD